MPMTACDSLLSTLRDALTTPTAQPLRPWNQAKPRVKENSPGYRLQLCTEGLGFESSSDGAEDVQMETRDEKRMEERHLRREYLNGDIMLRRGRAMSRGREFPPPISCIGQSGRPWVCFESHREDGRFVLKEIRIPTQEILQASREGGRLKLRFVQMDDEMFEENDGEECENGGGDEDCVDQKKSDEEETFDSKEEGRDEPGIGRGFHGPS